MFTIQKIIMFFYQHFFCWHKFKRCQRLCGYGEWEFAMYCEKCGIQKDIEPNLIKQ